MTALFAEWIPTGTSTIQSAEPSAAAALGARIEAIIAAHGGGIELLDGQSALALWGTGRTSDLDPVQAVRASFAIHACLKELDAAQPQVRMRIGIHTGNVAVCQADAAGRRTPTGQALDVAGRLAQSAPAGSTVVSHLTCRQVYGLFDLQSLPALTVRGETEPIQPYEVLRARPRSLARTLRGLEGTATEMVGREQEMERLRSAFRVALEKRRLQVVTVLGEAGIGKTRLLQEFQKWVEVAPQKVRFLCGRAAEEMSGLPFYLMRDAFAARFEIQESDSAALAREKFERGVLDLLSAGGGQPGGKPPPATFMGHLLGFDFSSDPAIRERLNDPQQIRHQAFQDFTRFFQIISQESSPASPSMRAALLVLEDVHWSDVSSLELLEHLVQTCQNVPLLVVLLARRVLLERRPEWGRNWPGHLVLDLRPLSRRQSEQLLQSLLRKATCVPRALDELILTGAGGNPFYIEETIRMLIDQKVIVPNAEVWRIELTRLEAASIPPTLSGVLLARLDGLPQLERELLQQASVVGHVFWDSALGWSTQGQDGEGDSSAESAVRMRIGEALASLGRRDLVVERQTCAFAGATEYAFRHELIRNAAYDSLATKERRAYHALAATWFIRHSGERIGEFAGLVAAHLEQAGQVAGAADWYGRAGQQARVSYDPALASEYFRKASGLLAAEPIPGEQAQAKRLEWQSALGEALTNQARWDEALIVCTHARALAEAIGEPLAQAAAWNALAYLQERRSDNRASIQAAEKAELLARKAGEGGRHELIRALHLRGWAFYRLADAGAVLALGERTLELCSAFNEQRGMGVSYKLLGVAHLQLGHYQEADAYFRKGLALCQQLGDLRNAGAMWSNLGESARLQGNFAAAAELYQEALDIARQIGHRDSEIVYLSNLAGARLGLRQFAGAEADLRLAIELTGRCNSCSMSETYSFLAQACLGQQRLAEACEAASHAVALACESENFLDLGSAWRVLGEAIAAKQGQASMRENGEPESPSAPAGINGMPESSFSTRLDPSACFAESVRVFEKIDARGEQARTLLSWVEFERRHGGVDQCRQREEQARRILSGLETGSPATVQTT